MFEQTTHIVSSILFTINTNYYSCKQTLHTKASTQQDIFSSNFEKQCIRERGYWICNATKTAGENRGRMGIPFLTIGRVATLQ